MSPYFLTVLWFEMIWNAEDQNNEFDKQEKKPRTIRFNLIVNIFIREQSLKIHIY